ncbi:BTB/POZ domain-containing protein [Ditylenchus destructor]|uniref:BTB/POZ domain-containing protein n=1 Tax=Ditylenchus destructor TaxID=166010 RepID=A0AAD4N852_9BILA|nr:BTB/POZ domain-containing protein [Ditylenchus destructor]
MIDFNKSVIVAEEQVTIGDTAFIHNTFWEISRTEHHAQYTNLQQQRIRSIVPEIDVKCKYFVSNDESFSAQLLFIHNQEILEQTQGFFYYNCSENYQESDKEQCTSVVIRLLDDKTKYDEEFGKRWASDVTFVVNGETCKGDRKSLAGVSPVFEKMLYGQFIEANQNVIFLDEIDSIDILKDFFMAVSSLRLKPNPTNVNGLLQLAHRFDVPFLVRDCEEHLKHCYELSVEDRITLAGRYDLKGLKLYIALSLTNEEWSEIQWNNWHKIRDLGIDLFMSGMFGKIM